MQTIGDYPAFVQRQKRLHRRAMRHTTTPAQRAQYVAEAIALRETGDAETGRRGDAATEADGSLPASPCPRVPASRPLVALVAQRDALIRRLAGEPDAAQRQALRGQL